MVFAFFPILATAQELPEPPTSVVVKAGRLLDVRKGTYIENAAVWIEGERIKEVGPASDVELHAPKDAKRIDLGRATVLPGLIDCHTHIMARIENTDDGYVLALATKSQAFRALEGAFNARITLNAGFTTVRDVESEGAGYADVALRDAIQQGIAEGPRMEVSTRGIAAVGQYEPFGVSPDLVNFPTGAQMISGIEDARRAVREQIGHGADLIKVYADWQNPTLTVEEMRVIVEEAHKQKLKVAAHATTPEGIKNAITAGVDSIEHGNHTNREDLEMMKANGTFLVPTLGVVYALSEPQKYDKMTPEQRRRRETFRQGMQQIIQLATSLGVKIASGFDASSPDNQGKNANEIIALTLVGMTPLQAIRAATLNASELMGWQDRVGAIEAGKYADLIAVEGDPLSDVTVIQQVKFVMKGGKVVKNALSP
jgi:imidazolonepropionase-like amidohydrolase